MQISTLRALAATVRRPFAGCPLSPCFCLSPASDGSRRRSILGKSSGSRHGRMSALGHKQTFAVQQAMSALPPITTTKAKFEQNAMSGLPLKADVGGAAREVHFRADPADITSPSAIRSPRPRWRARSAPDCKPQWFFSCEVDDKLVFCRRLHGRSAGFSPP